MKTFEPLDNVQSVIPILSKIAILGGFTEAQLYKIFQKLEVAVFQKDELVFQKGDEPQYVYIVKKGKVDLCVLSDGVMIQKKILTIGDCFGVASLFAIRRHTTSARVVEDSEIMVLSRKSLIELHKDDLALFALLMMNTARELARRLQLTDDILLHYLQSTGG